MQVYNHIHTRFTTKPVNETCFGYHVTTNYSPSNSMSLGESIGRRSFKGTYTSLPSLPIPRLVVEDWVMDP